MQGWVVVELRKICHRNTLESWHVWSCNPNQSVMPRLRLFQTYITRNRESREASRYIHFHIENMLKLTVWLPCRFHSTIFVDKMLTCLRVNAYIIISLQHEHNIRLFLCCFVLSWGSFLWCPTRHCFVNHYNLAWHQSTFQPNKFCPN
jgi:hypothetical protein